MRILSLIVTVPFSLFAVWFALSNRAETVVSLDYIDFKIGAPLYVFVCTSFILGFFGGALIFQIKRLKDRMLIRSLTKSNERLMNRLSSVQTENGCEIEKKDVAASEKPLFFKKQSDIIACTDRKERKLSL